MPRPIHPGQNLSAVILPAGIAPPAGAPGSAIAVGRPAAGATGHQGRPWASVRSCPAREEVYREWLDGQFRQLGGLLLSRVVWWPFNSSPCFAAPRMWAGENRPWADPTGRHFRRMPPGPERSPAPFPNWDLSTKIQDSHLCWISVCGNIGSPSAEIKKSNPLLFEVGRVYSPRPAPGETP